MIEVDPAKDPAPVNDPNPNTGAPIAKAAPASPAPAAALAAPAAALAAPAEAQASLARILPNTPSARVTTS